MKRLEKLLYAEKQQLTEEIKQSLEAEVEGDDKEALYQSRGKFEIFKEYVHNNLSANGRQKYLERVSKSTQTSMVADMFRYGVQHYLCHDEHEEMLGKEGEFTIKVAGRDFPCSRVMDRDEYVETYFGAMDSVLAGAAKEEFRTENPNEQDPQVQSDFVEKSIEDACDNFDSTLLSHYPPTHYEKVLAVKELKEQMQPSETSAQDDEFVQ